MSALVLEIPNSTKYQQFVWTEERSQAAVVLASGGTKQEAADQANVDRTTIYDWLKHPEFCAEIDRLSLMVHIASRAERLRIAMRVAKARVKDDDSVPVTDKDLLDWLKFAQSETDGAKIDLSKLAELLTGQEQDGPTTSQSSSQSPALLASADNVIDVEVSNSRPSPSSQSDELDFNPS